MKLIIDIPYEAYYTFKSDLGKGNLNALAEIVAHGTPYEPKGDYINRKVINSEIEKRYCSKHCVVPSEEPYCPDNCPARFLKNIVKECPPVPQVTVFTENTDEKAVADMKSELQSVLDSDRPKGEWVGINEYLKHLEEETGERYKVSKLYDGSIFCNQCWKMNNEKSCYCPNCGVDMKGGAE